MKVHCDYCGKDVGAHVPRGGDGSAIRTRTHKNTAGEPCPGRFRLHDAGDALADPEPGPRDCGV